MPSHAPRADPRNGLILAVLAEQHDEWAEMRHYIGLEVLAKARHALVEPDPETSEQTTEVTTPAIAA